MRRRLLLWQLADLFGQLTYSKTWWAAQDPETYGWWTHDAS